MSGYLEDLRRAAQVLDDKKQKEEQLQNERYRLVREGEIRIAENREARRAHARATMDATVFPALLQELDALHLKLGKRFSVSRGRLNYTSRDERYDGPGKVSYVESGWRAPYLPDQDSDYWLAVWDIRGMGEKSLLTRVLSKTEGKGIIVEATPEERIIISGSSRSVLRPEEWRDNTDLQTRTLESAIKSPFQLIFFRKKGSYSPSPQPR